MTRVLADTSVWADHLRQPDAVMERWLEQKRVWMHPYVMGELALGSLPRRGELLRELADMYQTPKASDHEVMRLIERGGHFSTGLGWVDINLLAAVLLSSDLALWTRDKRLNQAAAHYGRAAVLHH